ncbi:MAG: glycosyltransferase family 2 protein [Omnitrophica WOR_2 bacterium]
MDIARICALIPAYNEAEHIRTIVIEAQQVVPVVVINDGSIDSTAQIAESCGARVLNQIPNRGKGAALRLGFQYALQENYEAALTLDADGQHEPSEIPKFLKAYVESRADLIIGARNFKEMPPARRLANTLGQWSFSWAVGQSIQDNQSGYRLISHRLMEAVLESKEQGFEFEVEMIVTCLQFGYTLEWIPIQTIYAGEQSHIQPAKHVLNFIHMLQKTRSQIQRTKKRAGSPLLKD